MDRDSKIEAQLHAFLYYIQTYTIPDDSMGANSREQHKSKKTTAAFQTSRTKACTFKL